MGIYLMKDKEHEITEKMGSQRIKSVISGVVFGQTCFTFCKSK